MNKLSKRSIDYIELFLSLEDMDRVSLSKHDVKILYDYYKNAIFEINRLEDELLKYVLEKIWERKILNYQEVNNE